MLYVPKANLQTLHSGDEIWLNATIYPIPKAFNPYQFDYSNYLEKQNVFHQIYTRENQIKIIQTHKTIGFYIENLRDNLSKSFDIHHFEPKTKAIIADLVAQKNPLRSSMFSQKKFALYDAVLLRVLQEKKLDGAAIFTAIFSKNPPTRVFRFLNNESSLLDDLHIMASVPSRIFLPAALYALLGVKRRRGLN